MLEAIGVDPVCAQGSVVFTLGMDNTVEDVELFLKTLSQAVEKLREMSPLKSLKGTDKEVLDG